MDSQLLCSSKIYNIEITCGASSARFCGSDVSQYLPLNSVFVSAQKLLRALSTVAAEENLKLYLVGGAVRDILFGLPVREFDLTVNGDLKRWLNVVYDRWPEIISNISELQSTPSQPFRLDSVQPRRPIFFKKYLTGKIVFDSEIFPGMTSIDFSQLRSEMYQFSGSYPVVVPGDLSTDMHRRDFTVNAMFAELFPETDPLLLDLHSGKTDLETKTLRILHPQSFEDDPARLLRGARFQARFGMNFDQETAARFHDAVRGEYLNRIPKKRLFDEVRKVLQENDIDEMLRVLNTNGLTSSILPGISNIEAVIQSFSDTQTSSLQLWESRLIQIYLTEEFSVFADALRSFELERKEIERLLSHYQNVETSLRKSSPAHQPFSKS